MKWENLPRSENVEIDCLGLKTPFHTPEAQAAIACQQEVAILQQRLVEVTSKSPELADLTPTARMAHAKSHIEESFQVGIPGFMARKEQEPRIKQWIDHLTGKDPFKSRLQEFKEYLEIPPLETGKQKYR